MFNIITRFLLYLAVTDTQIILDCPKREIRRQEIIGFSVLLAAIFACVSGWYALYTVFENRYLSGLFSIFWGITILNIDRHFISSSFGTSSALRDELRFLPYIFPIFIRLFIAVLLGVIISIPLELKVFEPEIDAQLDNMQTSENRNSIKIKLDNEKTEAITIIKDEIARHSADIEKINKEKIELENNKKLTIDKNIAKEEREPQVRIYNRIRTRHGRYIDTYQYTESENLKQLKSDKDKIINEINDKKNQIKNLVEKNETLNNQINDIIKMYSKKYSESENNLNNLTEHKITKSLLSRYQALSLLSDTLIDKAKVTDLLTDKAIDTASLNYKIRYYKAKYTFTLQITLRLIIILIEVIPLILKGLSDKSPYDYLLGHYYKMYRNNDSLKVIATPIKELLELRKQSYFIKTKPINIKPNTELDGLTYCDELMNSEELLQRNKNELSNVDASDVLELNLAAKYAWHNLQASLPQLLFVALIRILIISALFFLIESYSKIPIIIPCIILFYVFVEFADFILTVKFVQRTKDFIEEIKADFDSMYR